MLTADDARALVKEAETGDRAGAAALMECWNRAIQKAASAGENSVRETSLPTLRMPISVTAREMAYEHVRAAGFTVTIVRDGPNESTVEVSW